MKYIIFGGFDYAVLHEMDSDAILDGVDYFVDNSPRLIGTTYLGKKIYSPEQLLNEDKDNIFILIGSMVYKSEIEYQLREMGFEKNIHFIWGINFVGDDKCRSLWRHIEWSDREGNSAALSAVESGDFHRSRLKLATSMIGWDSIDTFVDLGAANERAKEFVPAGVGYIPVDYIPYSEDTVHCNFNEKEFPTAESLSFSPDRTCMFSVGCLTYVIDWQWHLRKVAENCSTFILAHHDIVRIKRDYRMSGWTHNNALFDTEIILFMQELGFQLTDAVDFRLKMTLFKFQK